MTHILHIDVAAHFERSKTREASAKIVADLGGTVTRRDLAADPLPFVDAVWADTMLPNAPQGLIEKSKHYDISQTLIAELQAADTIVIGTPVYNFTAPASLKAWMDLVARPGVTFTYTETGPKGLLEGKKAIVVVASGGTPIGADHDYLTPHLRFFLGFMGITDVEFIAAANIAASKAA